MINSGHSLPLSTYIHLWVIHDIHVFCCSFDSLLLNPHMMYQYGVGNLLRGIISEPAKKSTPHLAEVSRLSGFV